MALVQQWASYKIKLIDIYRSQLSKPLAVCALLEREQAVSRCSKTLVFKKFSDIKHSAQSRHDAFAEFIVEGSNCIAQRAYPKPMQVNQA